MHDREETCSTEKKSSGQRRKTTRQRRKMVGSEEKLFGREGTARQKKKCSSEQSEREYHRSIVLVRHRTFQLLIVALSSLLCATGAEFMRATYLQGSR